MASHSPGPWSTGTDEDAHMIYDANDEVIADTIRDDGDGTAEATNSRLIAASPDLLAACVQAERWLAARIGPASVESCLPALRAAIARATREEAAP